MNNDYLLEKKIEVKLEMAVNKIVAEINTLKNSINDLNTELTNIKRQIRESSVKEKPVLVNQPAQQEVKQEKDVHDDGWPKEWPRLCQQSPIEGTEEKQQKPPEDKPIDRNKVAPSKVCMEKIFYCGKR